MTDLDPILKDFRAALKAVYGDRLDRVVLFGSRARGDARPDSDYDIAVFLKTYQGNRWLESDTISTVAARFLRSHDAFIHAMPYRAEQYDERSPLMHEIRGEGLSL
jgi:predicted nucleotidyltransferase